jgi:hypothetical protein
MSSTSAATNPNKSRGGVLAFKNGKLKVEQGERRVERVGLHSTVAALLRAELAEMRAQRDEWRARAERKSLAASIAVASRARSFWRAPEFRRSRSRTPPRQPRQG